MNELIKITEQNGEQAVSARELHAFLESKQQFADWIKNRIDKYGFIENQDFEVFHNSTKSPNGGRPLIEYALSLDCAKELSMLESNAKGRQARRYFIEVEKTHRNKMLQGYQMYQDILSLAEAQKNCIEAQKNCIEAQKQCIQQICKVEKVVNPVKKQEPRSNLSTITALTAIINSKGGVCSIKDIYGYLMDNGYLLKSKGVYKATESGFKIGIRVKRKNQKCYPMLTSTAIEHLLSRMI